MRRLHCVLAFVVVLAAPVAGQPADSSGVLATPADSLAAPPRPALDPFGAAPGHATTPVPAVTAALSVQSLMADAGPAVPLPRAPAAFTYDASAPGRVAGVSLDGLDPEAPALLLDGRPVEDLTTGAPRYDLLPFGVVGPLRLSDGALGRATALHTELRSFRLGVPVTELRYAGGGVGTRHAFGTHAQTRRAPGFLGGGDTSRLTLTGHASTRASDGTLSGGQLGHTDALARMLLARPGVVIETGVLYADRTEGARNGVVAASSQAPTAVFGAGATARESGATRRTLRTEGWARLRLPLAAHPTEAGVSLAAQRLIYRGPLAADTARVHGQRLAAFVEQPLRLGPNALRLRLDGIYEPALGPDGGALPAGDQLGVHLLVSDSLAVGALRLAAQAGAHRVGSDTWPSAAVRAESGPFSVGVRVGRRAPSRLIQTGLASRVLAGDARPAATLAADAALDLGAGDWRLALRAFGSATRDGAHLADQGDSLVVVRIAEGAVRQGGVRVEVGWRERTTRGLYARLGGTARALVDTDTELLERIDAALPRTWGRGRLGVRAEDVGNGVLDLDLAVVVHGWTSFRSRLIEPATGALVLPEPGAALGIVIPARAVLGAEATATFSARASLFVRYDNALAERVYNGALVTQGEPLAASLIRFGVFWALLN